MSLDIYAVIDTGGAAPVELGWLNITHNVHEQIEVAGADPWGWEGMPIADTIGALRLCLAALEDRQREEELRRFDASNGWGRLENSREFIRKLLALAEAHPKARWHVSR